MKFSRLWSLAQGLVVVFLLGATAPASAGYPDKPVRLVLPLAPGGAMDVLGRGLAERLGALWNVPVIVENRAGAGGNIAADQVARAAPDGYTLLLTGDMLVANQTLFKGNINYDPVKSFAPISIVAATPPVIVVRADSPVRDIAGLRDAASRNVLNVGTPGYGNSNHRALTRLQQQLQGTVQHVPYKGAGPAVVALLGGEIDAAIVALPAVSSLIANGQVRALAVLQDNRSDTVPQVPTAAQVGLKMDGDTGWFGLLAPAGTPPQVVDDVWRAVRQAVTEPDFHARLLAIGFEPIADQPRAFADRIVSDALKFPALLRDSGVALQ
ncbi:Bug family tripartite tricarboxylate transporter substrate binding protein [Achromobacter ruhlandii]|uniref:Tripartite tricarboxylate transporter substrate binding protein n=1 Tax=Achromobacter ruhlandii TaxID=72557 RepID=A0ABM8M0U5_9BURK|nr:tripartite tricarboxylate transporter substrate binding protein [Achromobacter ruhlandii]AKP90133.1 putative exported protein [Achromobacter xylosoxidans]MCZ8433328.1 tripartite tricarboxylate transporter substrate binding protein [Achromobacter ruhlandii]MDC6090858.1 tripartite tricarboxylate transporter substrate binding protein [Achromobacter ruhlandii]MDC6148649.1 tripartite tricarboxylate transporter substrate binding protein [Achromobacter ruhlandii]MDD7977858.1 tripartite tricarboxyl